MLTFLNSAILFGLIAVAVPIFIHLFTRQKTKTVYFSSLKFLKELQQRQIRRLKIRQILLLILRTLLVLALVLAFARPTVKTSTASSLGSGAQLTAVIILDNSMSMGRQTEGRRLLDRAKGRALEVLSTFRQGDEIHLVYPQTPTRFAYEGARYNLSSVEEMIRATEITYSGTDLVSALAAANKVMEMSSNINKEIYIISDLQKTGFTFDKAIEDEKVISEEVNVFILPVNVNNEVNLSVSAISVDNQILEKDKVSEVLVTIRNNGSQSVSNKLVHLFVNGSRTAQDVVDLPGEAAANLIFRMVPNQTGFQSGYTLLEDDILQEDNRRYFAFHIAEKIPVLLAGSSADDTHFLKLALRPQKEIASYIEMTDITMDQFDAQDLSQSQVIILSNVTRLTSAQSLKLKSFIQAGGGLMVFLGERVDLRNYNEYLNKQLQLPKLTQTLNESSKEQFLSLGKIDFSHPIFRGVFEEEKFVESPHVRFAIDIDASKSVERIIEYSNGVPFLFESQLQNGRILYSTTSLSQAWSDLVFKGFFVPLMNRSVFYLAGAGSAENEQVYVGNPLVYQSDNKAVGADFHIEGPGGSKVKIKPELSQGALTIQFNATDLPGIYGLYNKEQLVTQWACNYDPAETIFTQIDVDALLPHFCENQVTAIGHSENISDRLEQSRFGHEFWRILIAFALILLMLETAFSKARAQENKSTAPA